MAWRNSQCSSWEYKWQRRNKLLLVLLNISLFCTWHYWCSCSWQVQATWSWAKREFFRQKRLPEGMHCVWCACEVRVFDWLFFVCNLFAWFFFSNFFRSRLRNSGIAAVYASPMKRAMKTAEIIAQSHNIKVTLPCVSCTPLLPYWHTANVYEWQVQAEPAFVELNHGHWEMKTREEVEREYPNEYKEWEADPFSCKCENRSDMWCLLPLPSRFW